MPLTWADTWLTCLRRGAYERHASHPLFLAALTRAPTTPQKPKPRTTLITRSASTPITRTEVMCRKPGSFQPHIHGRSSMSVDEGPGASDSPTPVTYALGRDTAEAERLRRQTTELQPLASYWTESAPLRDKARSTSDAALGGILEVARRARRPPGPRRRTGGRPGPRRHGAGAGGRTRADERRGHPGRRPEHRAAARLVRCCPRPDGVGQRPRSRSGTGRNDAAGPSGRLGGQPGAGRGRPPVSPSQPRLGPTA